MESTSIIDWFLLPEEEVEEMRANGSVIVIYQGTITAVGDIPGEPVTGEVESAPAIMD